MYDESQPEPLTDHDTPNATTFYGDDVDYGPVDRLDGMKSMEGHYSRLARFNVGTYSYKWGDNAVRRSQDNLAILDAVAGFVDLNPYQKKVARMKMDQMPLSKWSSPNGVDGILVAICLCATILRNDWRSNRAYHPNRSDRTNDELFIELLGELSYRDSTIRSCIQKVQGHVNWNSVDWEQFDTMVTG